MLKINLKKISIISLYLLLLFSCSSAKYNKLNPVQKFENYDFDRNSNLIQRVQPTPEFLLEYLINWDSRPNYKDYKLDESERKILSDSFALIPESYRPILKDSLIGVYFIENFWGGGMTSLVVDSENNIYTVIFLNPILLKMNLNEAFLLKERSCFINNDYSYEIKVDISDEYNGILYILLHELTHAIDYKERLTPYAHEPILKFYQDKDSRYNYNGIWNDYSEINDSYNSPIFKLISFYGFNNGPLLNINESVSLYEELDKTPFLTPYSTMSWAEDLADLYAIYYLVNNLDCNFEISIFENDDKIYEYKPFERKLIKERVEKITLF